MAFKSSLSVITTAWSLIASFVSLPEIATPNVVSIAADAFWHSR